MTLRNLWPFRRRYRNSDIGPVVDRRAEAGVWRRGDLAVCVARFAKPSPFDPKVGDVLRVARVEDGIGDLGSRSYFLYFQGKPAGRGWIGVAFRHAALDHSAADAEFVANLRAGRLSEMPTEVDV